MSKLLAIVITLIIIGLGVPKYVFAEQGAMLYFDPETLEISKDAETTVDLYVDTRNVNVVGIDLVLSYDPNYIEIIKITDQHQFSSEIYENINNSSGTIKAAFSNSFGTYSSGNLNFASLTLKGKKDVSGAIIFINYEPGNTKDTNVVTNHGSDILGNVSNLSLNTNSGQASPTLPTKNSIPITSDNETKVQDLASNNVDISSEKEEVEAKKDLKKVLGVSSEKNKNLPKWLFLIAIPIALAVSIGSYLVARELKNNYQIK
ncbi:hypothetical protein A3D00_03910 [Candidatus Woesebacteria bacterium RIFCSPHIGHO2_02_FULL_38_9]|uniref:Cohesin domain-containing protein n=1 Tax=Candidatus Woesebacteria bacterium RIFCSPHIGHO2_01_FULL_39_28 TaxID=1802496 RepID=A0A1F7YIR1_9BACT|nr:MAG: hypothetical protein A2627_03225 [Candidatus Woesebacteria bacterium RIFCSPHIGHO2_01_FULL_39_28]OGM31811.1 MAG: hypothetical protein A3D00_03910 [Candidatus Woesebacteria bacterium RIFCSPHIGHO2_02_FULL_38_9]OGM56942.1 MAG: hypothetical protein A3A50_03570 [Candidatus Woesebacteria bacterium RIFCSPLOWO2_01_FULL_38_20]